MRFVFISTMESVPWGGSEQLWSQAGLRLAAMGHAVAASVRRHDTPMWRDAMARLRAGGVSIQPRRGEFSMKSLLIARVRAKWSALPPVDAELRDLFRERPDLVVISEGSNWPPRRFVQPCIEKRWPYAVLAQAAGEHHWPGDDLADDLRAIYSHARGAYFVSRANLEVTKLQSGLAGGNFHVVRNPFNVPYDARVPMPGRSGTLHMAFVGRLDPSQKGCDLLLRVLADPEWRTRDVVVNFFGTGASDRFVRDMAANFGLQNVRFHGHVEDVVQLWRENHILVLPSRSEGLPLAIVEAMLCSRPCIVTDIAGNAELLEEGVTGFIAPAPTVEFLRQAMERAWSQRARWAEMGEAAAAAVRQQVPPDPGAVFAEELSRLSARANACSN